MALARQQVSTMGLCSLLRTAVLRESDSATEMLVLQLFLYCEQEPDTARCVLGHGASYGCLLY